MRNTIILIGVILFWYSDIKSQTPFKRILDSSEVIPPVYYSDENGNNYQRHSISGMFYYVEFTKVELIGNCDSFLIEGYTLSASSKDWGIGGVSIFLGKTRRDTIYSVRSMGESNDMSKNPDYKDGFFSFICKIASDDKLFFSEFKGGGLCEFMIGKLVLKKNGKVVSHSLPGR
jgi:hypothetical protein